jgi:hypothetical protein
MTTRMAYLDWLADVHNIRVEFYDPAGKRYGIPTYPFHMAPSGWHTMRQLRSMGLRPGGQDIAGQIIWKHDGKRRKAYLYKKELAKPKREATPAQKEAIAKALQARRTCASCQAEKDYYIPRSLGECLDCSRAARNEPEPPEPDPEIEASWERERQRTAQRQHEAA